jgi:toxin ParE1/3/4
MANYRITEDAKEDLRRIYRRGVKEYGEAQADKYHSNLFERFEEIAKNPLLYQSVDSIRIGYRRSFCGADSIFYRIAEDVVEIIAIIGRQDSDNIL